MVGTSLGPPCGNAGQVSRRWTPACVHTSDAQIGSEHRHVRSIVWSRKFAIGPFRPAAVEVVALVPCSIGRKVTSSPCAPFPRSRGRLPLAKVSAPAPQKSRQPCGHGSHGVCLSRIGVHSAPFPTRRDRWTRLRRPSASTKVRSRRARAPFTLWPHFSGFREGRVAVDLQDAVGSKFSARWQIRCRDRGRGAADRRSRASSPRRV